MKMSPIPSRHLRVAAAALALCAVAGTSQALEYKLSGHVNRLLTQVDDGAQSRLFHADNINSQTRFRFTGSHEVMPGLTAGINWEMGYTSNPSSAINMSTPSVAATLNERHAEAYLLGDWGKVSFGQGDGAANGGMEVDLSGTSVINYSSTTDIGGNFAFRQGTAFGPSIGSTIDNLDFESRYDRIRYDSPRFGPVVLSGSFGTKGSNDVYELAAWVNTPLAGGKFAGALGWSREKRGGIDGNKDTAGSSLSWLAANGLNATVAAGFTDVDNPAVAKKKYYYGKLGYIIGKHAVSVDYGRGKDFAAVGDESDSFGVGYVYAAHKWIDLYAGAKQHKLDRVGSNFDNVSFVTVGTRLKF